jgi:hypothetical protein
VPIRALLLLALAASPVRADPVADWVAGAELAATARAERDAVLLAAAARQMALAEAADSSLAAAPRNARQMLADARSMAGTDSVARAVIDRYEGLQPRGSLGGASTRALPLRAGAEQVVPRRFRPGQSAIVFADAPAAIQLIVENGTDICRRTVAAGQLVCRWLPASADPVNIRIRNLGPADTQVTLITN